MISSRNITNTAMWMDEFISNIRRLKSRIMIAMEKAQNS